MPGFTRSRDVWRRTRLTPRAPAARRLVFGFPTAAVTGTATAAITETDVVAGGKTIIITLAGDIWVAAGASFDAQRQNIINGLDSAQGELLGWDLVVKALQGVAGVVRTSDTVVTITLDAQITYNITAQETITATVPASAVVGAASAITATPTFTVDAVGVAGHPATRRFGGFQHIRRTPVGVRAW